VTASQSRRSDSSSQHDQSLAFVQCTALHSPSCSDPSAAFSLHPVACTQSDVQTWSQAEMAIGLHNWTPQLNSTKVHVHSIPCTVGSEWSSARAHTLGCRVNVPALRGAGGGPGVRRKARALRVAPHSECFIAVAPDTCSFLPCLGPMTCRALAGRRCGENTCPQPSGSKSPIGLSGQPTAGGAAGDMCSSARQFAETCIMDFLTASAPTASTTPLESR